METVQIPDSVADSDGKCRILHAAYPLFVEHGYKSVSMQQIADAVTVHKATLYHHFRNKDAIFTAVVRMALSQIRSQVASIMESGGIASGQFAQIALQMFNNTQSDIGRLMTDVQEHLPTSERIALMKDELNPWDLYEQIFRNAILRGELPDFDTRLATSMFIGLVHGQAWARKIGRVEGPLNDQVAQAIVDTLFAGLRGTARQIPAEPLVPAHAGDSVA